MIYIIALRLWPVVLQYKLMTINSSINLNIFGSVMVCMLSSSAVYRGREQNGRVKPKNYKIGICCFLAIHVALRSTCKSKEQI